MFKRYAFTLTGQNKSTTYNYI